MVTGKRPFTGSSIAATFDAILIDEPPPILGRELPSELSRIINRALEKDRDSRYQTADHFKTEIQRLRRPAVAPALSRSRATYLMFAVLVLAGFGYFAFRNESGSGVSALKLSEAKYIKQTAGPGRE
jgi:serine/threonine protein kinase